MGVMRHQLIKYNLLITVFEMLWHNKLHSLNSWIFTKKERRKFLFLISEISEYFSPIIKFTYRNFYKSQLFIP